MGTYAGFYGNPEKGFEEFLLNMEKDELKKEYLLPELIDSLLRSGRACVEVLETKDTWFGVTYQEDKAAVATAFGDLIQRGVYPKNLYEQA